MPSGRLVDLAGIAAGQWGLVTAAQARSRGVSRQVLARLARADELERLAYGVYRLAGTPPHPHDELRTAWLALDPARTAAERIADDFVDTVSHRSAALLHDLGDIDADSLEFTTPVRHQSRRSDVRTYRGMVMRQERTLVDGLPATRPLRTIRDLATAHTDRGHLAGVVRDAILQHHLMIPAVADALSAFARRYGVPAGNGDLLVEILLREAGVPQTTLDVAARMAPS